MSEQPDRVLPRTLNRFSSAELDRVYGGAENVPKGRRFANSAMPSDGFSSGGMASGGAEGPPNVGRGPSRKWYDPEWTGLSLLVPKSRTILNRWYRHFYRRDPIIGGVIDLHSDLPFSKASLSGVEDTSIRNAYEVAVDRVNLFSKLPEATNEYLKIGEAFPYYRWDGKAGNFSHIMLQNPDFIEVDQSMFLDEDDKFQLAIDPQLRSYIESTNPQAAYQKRKLPMEFIKSIVYGERIDLPFDENDLFIAIIKRDSPSDVRGNSMIARLINELIYEDKLRDAQISIADNFMYPLRMMLVGNDTWTPNSEQLDAFQELLLQKQFDQNFWLVTHNAVKYESHPLATDVMSLSNEWERIDKLKMIGLGMSQGFLTGDSSYATAHVGWQTAMARYKNLRHLMETKMVLPFFREIAIRNKFFKVSKRELAGQYRVSKSKQEEESLDNLIIPKLDWEKKLIVREDESYLQFLAGLMSKFPISNSTFLSAIGMSLQEELEKSTNDEKLMVRMGLEIKNPNLPAKGKDGEEDGGDSEGGLFSFIRGKRKKKFAEETPKEKAGKTDFLKTLAVNLHKVSESKGVDKTADEIYTELLVADSMPIDDRSANFLVGVEKNKNNIADFMGKEGSKTYEESLTERVASESYELNYNLSHLNSKVIGHLYDIDTELNREACSIQAIEKTLCAIVEDSAKSVEPYIFGRNSAIDKDFIFNVIKSDVTSELSRLSTDIMVNKDKIKKLALASVFLGNITHYVNERVDKVRISSNGNYTTHNLMDTQSKGISSAYEMVTSGVIPEVYPFIIDSEDNLKKWNYISDVNRKKYSVKNCPRFLVSDLLLYLKVFSRYIPEGVAQDSIIFGSEVEKSSAFINFVKRKYAVPENDEKNKLEHAIVENERTKFYRSNIFSNNSNLYVNYNIFSDFKSNYELFKYMLPYDIQKFSESHYDKYIKHFALTDDKIQVGLLSGWLLPDNYSSYKYKVASDCKNIYSAVDYFDDHGNAHSINKAVFTDRLMSIFFDKKYLVNKDLINLIG